MLVWGETGSSETLVVLTRFAYTEKRTERVTAVFSTQIEVDAQGVGWVSGTKTKVVEIVLDKIACGWSPEEIHFQHPHLSLAQIHGALTWYYENQAGIDAEVRNRMDSARVLAGQVSDPEFRRKLANLKHSI